MHVLFFCLHTNLFLGRYSATVKPKDDKLFLTTTSYQPYVPEDHGDITLEANNIHQALTQATRDNIPIASQRQKNSRISQSTLDIISEKTRHYRTRPRPGCRAEQTDKKISCQRQEKTR